MIQNIKNLNLTWIKNNKDLALHILTLACCMWLANYAFSLHERFEDYLIQSKKTDLETAKQNFDNSQQLLKLIK